MTAPIGTLAPPRPVLLPVDVEGLTCEGAAARLDGQVGTVKSRVSRARRFLTESSGRRTLESDTEEVMRLRPGPPPDTASA